MKCMHCGGPVGADGQYAHGGMVEDGEVPSDEYMMEPSSDKESEENEIEEYPDTEQQRRMEMLRSGAFASAIKDRSPPGPQMRNEEPDTAEPEPQDEEDSLDAKKRARYGFGRGR